MIRTAAGAVLGVVMIVAAASAGAGAAGASSPRAASQPSPRAVGLQRPVIGAVVTQEFGCSPYVFEPYTTACASHHWHSGIDLAAPAGTTVWATLGGTAHVFRTASGYGLHVVIDHGSGLSSLYGHLSSVTVAEGVTVRAGQPIGAVGSTGNSTGPHLHFEVRRDDIPENPRLDVQLP